MLRRSLCRSPLLLLRLRSGLRLRRCGARRTLSLLRTRLYMRLCRPLRRRHVRHCVLRAHVRHRSPWLVVVYTRRREGTQSAARTAFHLTVYWRMPPEYAAALVPRIQMLRPGTMEGEMSAMNLYAARHVPYAADEPHRQDAEATAREAEEYLVIGNSRLTPVIQGPVPDDELGRRRAAVVDDDDRRTDHRHWSGASRYHHASGQKAGNRNCSRKNHRYLFHRLLLPLTSMNSAIVIPQID